MPLPKTTNPATTNQRGAPMADANEKLSISAPKGIVAIIVALLLGGGGTYAAHALIGSPAQASPMVAIQPQEAVGVAEVRARAYADDAAMKAAEKARDDCRRELATVQGQLGAVLGRVEKKIDDLAESVSDLKTDVAVLKATKRGK